MGYFARERFFTGRGPNSRSWAVVFSADDLTEEECTMLAASVQKCMDIMHEEGGSGPLEFDLEPSAHEDAATFINLKSEWENTKGQLDRYRIHVSPWLGAESVILADSAA